MATQSNRAMVSETSICNQALTWLGQRPISSIDESSTTAEWMRRNYPFLRDAVLSERMWTFATARDMSISEDRDAWGSMYVHPIPLNWLAVYRVFLSVNQYGQGGTPDPNWRLEDGGVLSSEGTVYLWGLKQVTDTGKFSSLFNQALAARVAADAAIPLTENRQLQREMWALYQAKLADAAARDGQQGSNEIIQSNSLLTARTTYGRGDYGNWLP